MWLSWRARWRTYEYVRNSLWIVPLLFVAVAVTLGLVLPIVDERTSTTIGISFGEDAARAVLGAVASGMITFTGFVFSILLIAVQFGSSQFSPRLLRRFLRDPTTKAALGIFMATFIYALAVLRVVGTGTNAAFVPNNSISVAILLLLFSMLMFLRLMSRTTQGLRVAAVLAELGADARRVIDAAYPNPVTDTLPAPEESLPSDASDAATATPARRTVTYHGAAGVVQSIDMRNLTARAAKADAVIELAPRLGELIADGSALFTVRGGRSPIDDDWLRGTVATGDERTMQQDPAFAFRLFADISAKALSPGVNDPTTSVQALDQIELLLRQLGTRRLTPGVSRDGSGTVRVRYTVPSWEDYLSLAIDETRQYGAGSIQVLRRLRALLENVRAVVPEPRRVAVDAELALLDATAERVYGDSSDHRAALKGDRQGLGATEIAALRLPYQPTGAHDAGQSANATQQRAGDTTP